MPAWSVRLSFPQSVAVASSRELTFYALIVSVICAVATALILIAVVSQLMRPLRALSQAMADVTSGDADLRTSPGCQGQ